MHGKTHTDPLAYPATFKLDFLMSRHFHIYAPRYTLEQTPRIWYTAHFAPRKKRIFISQKCDTAGHFNLHQITNDKFATALLTITSRRSTMHVAAAQRLVAVPRCCVPHAKIAGTVLGSGTGVHAAPRRAILAFGKLPGLHRSHHGFN